jgi:hypothetical protein
VYWGFGASPVSGSGTTISFNAAGYGGSPFFLSTSTALPVAGSTHTYLFSLTADIYSFYWDGLLVQAVSTATVNALTSGSSNQIYWQGSGGLTNAVQTQWVPAGIVPNSSSATGSCSCTIGSPLGALWPDANVASDSTFTSTAIVRQQNDNIQENCLTVASYNYCVLNCVLNFANTYGQFVGLSSTGYTGTDFGFQYYTDGNLYLYESGTQVLSLGTPTFPVAITIQLNNGGVVYYMNGAVVRTNQTVPPASAYQGVFQLWAVNDTVYQIAFSYFQASINLGTSFVWDSYGGATGSWYDQTGAAITDLSTAGQYAYLDPTTMNPSTRNTFAYSTSPQAGRMVLPYSGIWILSWTMDGISAGTNMNWFISQNCGNGADLTTANVIYAMVASIGENTVSMTATLPMYTTDYFTIGVNVVSGFSGLSANTNGSFTAFCSQVF